MFRTVSPESIGIFSEKVLEFLTMLDDCRLHTHSILMARGNQIFTECYYKPFDVKFLHRMYSVSKSFVAIAVGLAVTEGVMSMDEVIAEEFPEFRNGDSDEFYDKCTVRDMLTMRSNIASNVYWWGKFKSRVEAYYTQKTAKVPGTLYYYDSIGSFLLGCMIEKRTGKTFLQYLKEKVLLEIGFSKESYVLKEPGGFSVGDSGVMCSARDLALFARFVMQKGQWNGKQYIDRTFMEEAVMKQTSNDLNGAFDSYNTRGYGYLFWITHEDGFSMTGLGDQLAICDLKRDLLFVITSDNQAEKAARHVIYHEYYRHFLPEVQDQPLPENPKAHRRLQEYLNSRELISLRGGKINPLAASVSGVRYAALNNPLKISWFTLHLGEESGELTFEREGKPHVLPFDLCRNRLTKFSFGERAKADHMGIVEEGLYDCAISAAWVEENTFAIQAQVIDTYFGCLNVHICYQGNQATLRMSKSGQYVFDGMEGCAIGTAINIKK